MSSNDGYNGRCKVLSIHGDRALLCCFDREGKPVELYDHMVEGVRCELNDVPGSMIKLILPDLPPDIDTIEIFVPDDHSCRPAPS